MSEEEVPYQYKSVTKAVEGHYKDRGSKFIAYVVPVKSIEEIDNQISTISDLHPKSRHLCYAYRLGIIGEPYRFNDDGEPSGSAGRPIFNELLSAGLSDVFCGVIRYFGGTKLGVPGLIKAYKEATKDALEKAERITISLTKKVMISYHVEDMGKLYDLLKQRGFEKIDSYFEPSPYLVIDVNLNDLVTIRRAIIADFYGYGINDISEDFESDRISVKILD